MNDRKKKKGGNMLWTFLSSDMIDMVAPGGGGALWTMMCSMSVIAILSAIDQN